MIDKTQQCKVCGSVLFAIEQSTTTENIYVICLGCRSDIYLIVDGDGMLCYYGGLRGSDVRRVNGEFIAKMVKKVILYITDMIGLS